jgi:hypothetical protein
MIDEIIVNFQGEPEQVEGKRGGVVRIFPKAREVRRRVDIEVGPGTDANRATRAVVFEMLKEARPEEEFFYVVAHFRNLRRAPAGFRTITPRQSIPFSVRRLRR